MEELKNSHWIVTVLISIFLFFKKIIKNKLTKSEKELFQKIKNTNDKKIVFIKFDNTEPFSRDINIKYDDKDLILLTKKGFLEKNNEDNNIIYTILNI